VYIYIYSINQKNKSKFPKSIFSKNLKLFSRNLSQSQQYMSKFHHLKLKTSGWAERSTSCRERVWENGGRRWRVVWWSSGRRRKEKRESENSNRLRESESEPILFSFFLLFIISNLYFGLVSKMIVLLLVYYTLT
jgi:hypothetical protein